MQLELDYNGVAIIGSRLRQINYSNDVTSVEFFLCSAAISILGCN